MTQSRTSGSSRAYVKVISEDRPRRRVVMRRPLINLGTVGVLFPAVAFVLSVAAYRILTAVGWHVSAAAVEIPLSLIFVLVLWRTWSHHDLRQVDRHLHEVKMFALLHGRLPRTEL